MLTEGLRISRPGVKARQAWENKVEPVSPEHGVRVRMQGQRGGDSEGTGPTTSAPGVIAPLLLEGTEGLPHLGVCGINVF